MQAEEIQALVSQGISNSQVEVSIDGSHVAVSVVSDAFAGLSPVKRQQLVYATLQPHIASGAIHAVHLKTYTHAEFQANA